MSAQPHNRTSPRSNGNGRVAAIAIARALEERLGPRYDMWFGRTALGVNGTRLDVATESPFVARWIERHFAGDLHAVTREVLGEGATVRIDVRPAAAPLRTAGPAGDGAPSGAGAAAGRRSTAPSRRPRAASVAPARPDDSAAAPGEVGANGLRHLAEFVVGECNRLAHSAACRMLEEPAASLSPFFIHGDCGVGKSHLLQGVCRAFAELDRARRVRYMTGEQFTNQYIAAVRAGTLDRFRRTMRRLDLLAIDDVHFLSDKVRTQSEFLHTLDAIDLAGGRVVLASDQHPHAIGRFSQALISRFLAGMVVQMERPDRATRLELARRLAGSRGLHLNAAAADTLAERCVGSVREMEGTITKLAALQSLRGATAGEEVGIALIDRLFGDRVVRRPAGPVRVTSVIEVVCARLGIDRAELVSTRRHQRVVLARALVSHLGRDMTTQSYPEIAAAIGRTYHSTVHTAATRLRRQLEDDQSVSLGNGASPVRLRDLVQSLREEVVRSAGR